MNSVLLLSASGLRASVSFELVVPLPQPSAAGTVPGTAPKVALEPSHQALLTVFDASSRPLLTRRFAVSFPPDAVPGTRALHTVAIPPEEASAAAYSLLDSEGTWTVTADVDPYAPSATPSFYASGTVRSTVRPVRRIPVLAGCGCSAAPTSAGCGCSSAGTSHGAAKVALEPPSAAYGQTLYPDHPAFQNLPPEDGHR